MQIQYCDDCGTRVDDTEAVSAGSKIYCRECAKKHAPARKTENAPAMAGAARQSARIPRPRTTPARTITGTARVAAGGLQTPFTSSNADELDDAGDDVPPPSGLFAALQLWAANNSALAISLAAGLGGVVVFVAWSFLVSGERNSRPNAAQSSTDIAATSVNATVTKTETKSTLTPSTATTHKTPTPNIPAPDADLDPRTSKATRDLKAIKDIIATGKANPYDVRKRLEHLIEPFWIRKTPLGIEAAAMLEKYRGEKRQPDKAEDASPGVTADLIFEKAAENFNTDFKPAETKIVSTINCPNVAAIKATFGRDMELAVRCTGFITVPADGDYTFYTSSDDGSMFYIGDNLLINNSGSHALTERDGSIDLKAGKHAFRLDYYQGIGAAGLILSWSGPGLVKQPIPANALSSIQKK